MKRTGGLGLIVVDYLQLLTPQLGVKSENRVQEISNISRSLKAIAKELDVPVLALSQLSRPSNSARTSARTCLTCVSPGRSSRTPMSCCSSIARNIT